MALARKGRACVVALLAALAVGNAHAQATAKPVTIKITIRDMAFTPAESAARVGDVIEWTNGDVVDHTATAVNKSWDVTIPAGKSVRVTMKQAGTFAYYCRFHPNMTARMVVKKP